MAIFFFVAGVVKLADALDSKSSGLHARVGSNPTLGTQKSPAYAGLFFYRYDYSNRRIDESFFFCIALNAEKFKHENLQKFQVLLI